MEAFRPFLAVMFVFLTPNDVIERSLAHLGDAITDIAALIRGTDENRTSV